MVLGRVISLEDYAGRKYPSLPPGSAWSKAESFFSQLLRTPLTSLADVVIVAKVAECAGEHRTHVRVRHASEVLSRDFQADNSVIIGGIRANPWAGLFEQGLNFRYRINREDGRGEIVNLKPSAGELPTYTNQLGVRRTGKAYARIALVPNLANNGHVMLIAGVTTPSAEAAGDFMLRPASVPILLQALKLRNLAQAGRFEVLLETSVLEGTPREMRIVAVR